MNAVGPRWQFGARDLLESVAWVALGIGSLRLAFTIDLPDSQQESILVALGVFALLVFLLFSPGAAFGAAVGVLLRKRAKMAVLGYFAWPFLMLAGILAYALLVADH